LLFIVGGDGAEVLDAVVYFVNDVNRTVRGNGDPAGITEFARAGTPTSPLAEVLSLTRKILDAVVSMVYYENNAVFADGDTQWRIEFTPRRTIRTPRTEKRTIMTEILNPVVPMVGNE
jgi:hypothetical protein